MTQLRQAEKKNSGRLQSTARGDIGSYTLWPSSPPGLGPGCDISRQLTVYQQAVHGGYAYGHRMGAHFMETQTPIGFSVYKQLHLSYVPCSRTPPQVGTGQKKGGRVDNNGKKAKKYFPHIARKHNYGKDDPAIPLCYAVSLFLFFVAAQLT